MSKIQLKLYLDEKDKDRLIAGLDESGQGPLFGRVYGAVVILNPEIDLHPFLNDSKKMTPQRRNVVREWIEENALDYQVCWRDEKRIDEINILNAKMEAWHEAISKLNIEPELLLVDGTQFKPYWVISDEDYVIPYNTIIKGDSQYAAISAASVLAKEYHDQYIREICEQEPELEQKYHLCSNKGYGTGYHIWALTEYGPSKYHRKSFLKNIKNVV
jgi:ribonuclease HII